MIAGLEERVRDLEVRLREVERGPVAPAPAVVETRNAYQDDEKARILEALRTHKWNRLKAAESLGIPRRTFYRRLQEFGIE